MKRKFIAITLTLLCILCLTFGLTACNKDNKKPSSNPPTSSQTDASTEGLNFTLNQDGKSYSVTGIGSVTDKIIIIPKTYNNLPVTSIGNWAFDDCSSLTSITIPNSVTSIGDNAFRDCSKLTSISLGNSVASIGDGAFSDCSALTNVTIPNSVTSIADTTFYGCSSLTSISLGNSVASIGDAAFSDCSSLTSISIPNSVTSIGNRAFSGCSKLTTVYYDGTQEEWNKIIIHKYNNELNNVEIIMKK